MVQFEKEVHWYWLAPGELKGRSELSDGGWQLILWWVEVIRDELLSILNPLA